MRPGSRRDVFSPHVANRIRLRRCPICQAALEADHVEALEFHARRGRPPATANTPATMKMPAVRLPAAPLRSRAPEVETETAEFALV